MGLLRPLRIIIEDMSGIYSSIVCVRLLEDSVLFPEANKPSSLDFPVLNMIPHELSSLLCIFVLKTPESREAGLVASGENTESARL